MDTSPVDFGNFFPGSRPRARSASAGGRPQPGGAARLRQHSVMGPSGATSAPVFGEVQRALTERATPARIDLRHDGRVRLAGGDGERRDRQARDARRAPTLDASGHGVLAGTGAVPPVAGAEAELGGAVAGALGRVRVHAAGEAARGLGARARAGVRLRREEVGVKRRGLLRAGRTGRVVLGHEHERREGREVHATRGTVEDAGVEEVAVVDRDHGDSDGAAVGELRRGHLVPLRAPGQQQHERRDQDHEDLEALHQTDASGCSQKTLAGGASGSLRGAT
jgi:hypothetical protein